MSDAETQYKLSVSWLDEDSGSIGDDGDFAYTFPSETEAREFLAKFIEANKRYEIWWSLNKVEKIAEGHLERRDINEKVEG